MLDFENSVAHLDIDVQTAVRVSSVIGDNYWKFLYICNFADSELTGKKTPVLITSGTYVDIVDALSASDAVKKRIKKDLGALFENAPSREGYIIQYSDYAKFKYYGALCYLQMDYEYTPASSPDPAKLEFDSNTEAMLISLQERWDKAFSLAWLDIPVDAAAASTNAVPGAEVDALLGEIAKLTFDSNVFARGANTDYAWDSDQEGEITIGYSPAMLQLGETLSVMNSTGTPIGNSMDTVAIAFADVLPTRDVDPAVVTNASAMWINWAQTNNVQYFKTLGNGTMQISCYGGWTIKHDASCARWIVMYCNFMTKIAVAEVITVMNTYKSEATYNKCLAVMTKQITPFVDLGRVEGYQVTAPAFSELPATDGHTISIPDAWIGVYKDNVRKVNIQGALDVAA